MDPVSIIVAALVAGAATGATKVAGEAIGDAYQGFKGLLKKLFRRNGDPDADRTVDELSKDPKDNEDALRAKLEEHKAGDDSELVEAARELLAKADPAGYQSGKYNVTVTGGQGVQVGSGNTQTNNFGSK